MMMMMMWLIVVDRLKGLRRQSVVGSGYLNDTSLLSQSLLEGTMLLISFTSLTV